jgi:hypothetical protein
MAVIPTRVTEHVYCARTRRPAGVAGLRGWSITATAFRGGRPQISLAAWPIHVFEEHEYCYGIGPLVMRLKRVEWGKPIPHEGDVWLEVEGTVIDPRTGRPGPVRQVLVRASRLPNPPARKRPRLRP